MLNSARGIRTAAGAGGAARIAALRRSRRARVRGGASNVGADPNGEDQNEIAGAVGPDHGDYAARWAAAIGTSRQPRSGPTRRPAVTGRRPAGVPGSDAPFWAR